VQDLLNAPENVWTTIVLILMQSYKDVKPRPRPPPRTRAPTVDVANLPTPSSRARATSRPATANLSNSSFPRLSSTPGVKSPLGAESGGANAKRPPPVPRTSKPALTFKKAPVINTGNYDLNSPKQPATPSASGNTAAYYTTPEASGALKRNDLTVYNDDKDLDIDDIDLGELGGDDFDPDIYFKKLANDLVSFYLLSILIVV